MSVTDWSDELLDSLRTQAIPPRMPSWPASSPGPPTRRRPSERWWSNSTRCPTPSRPHFSQAKDDPPAGWTPTVAAGQEWFARWGSHVFTALYAAALPSAYARWRGVQVLGLTARLETDTKRRLNETAQFHLDVMETGGLEFGGAATRTCDMSGSCTRRSGG